MRARSRSLSDQHVAWASRLFCHTCPTCGGAVPLSHLTGRGRGWPQIAECRSCGRHWRVALSFRAYLWRFLSRAIPLVFFSLFVTSAALHFAFPELSYLAQNGQTKLRFVAFPFLVFAAFASVLFFSRRLPLEEEPK